MKSYLLLFLILFGSGLRAQVLKPLDQLNSKFRETNLSITPNGKYLYFLSDRGGQPWSEKRQDAWSVEREQETGPGYRYDGDIWYSKRVNGTWTEPVCLGSMINTSNGEDEPNISADGQRVYFQSWRSDWEQTGGPYYMARLDGARWGRPVGLGGAITDFFQDMDGRAYDQMIRDLKKARILDDVIFLERQGKTKALDRLLEYKGINMDDYSVGTDGMGISPNERVMVLSVYDPEKKGFDLYLSQRAAGKDWSYPRPLNINSEQDEISVFIAADNRTLYFASDRPGGFGGFDVYKTTIGPNGRCSTPVNLGPKYNRGGDEYGFIIDMLAGDAFVISNGDICQVELARTAQPEKSIVLDGKVVDPGGKPLVSTVYLIEKGKADTLSVSTSNGLSGEYGFSFRRQEGNYRLLAVGPNGNSGRVDFRVEEKTGEALDFTIVIGQPDPPVTRGRSTPKPAPEPEEVVSEPRPELPETADLEQEAEGVLSKPVARGEEKVFVINNIRFESDRSTLGGGSYESLDRLAELLLSKPNTRFEIGGHTNILPPEDYCNELSAERAKSVYDYLIKKGVPRSRLTYKGYGKSQPIETDPDVELQKVNQRVEIKVLE